MFASRYQIPGVSLMDIVAEGNLGLMVAAKRFDPELGYRFSTYAKWWIRKAILLALPKLSSIVYVPISEITKRKSLRQLKIDAFQAKKNDAEINLNDAVLNTIEFENADFNAESENSAESEVADDGSYCYSDDRALALLPIDQDLEPPNIILSEQQNSVLQLALTQLSEREKIIITERFALQDDNTSTLEELSHKFGVSIERIRQIESAALKKLKLVLQSAGLDNSEITRN
jgi:RNA polymerase nonessential primary-like sigma factor